MTFRLVLTITDGRNMRPFYIDYKSREQLKYCYDLAQELCFYLELECRADILVSEDEVTWSPAPEEVWDMFYARTRLKDAAV
jgi:hypothetical protein